MPLDQHDMIIGPYRVDATGRFSPRAPGTVTDLRARWREREVRVRIVPAESARPLEGSEALLTLEIVLGRVPSTAEARGAGFASAAAWREASFAVLRHLAGGLAGELRLLLPSDHRVLLATTLPVTLPMLASDMLTEVTRFLLESSPYLDLLDDARVTLPVGEMTRPGAERAMN